MKRILLYQRHILTSVLLMLCIPIAAHDKSVFRSPFQSNQTIRIDSELIHSDTILLNGISEVYSLSLDATIFQPREASFTRIILEDTNGNNYLIAESDWFRNDTTVVELRNYCEETAKLDGITPLIIKCYFSQDVSITLHTINLTTTPPNNLRTIESSDSIKKMQVQNIISRINTYNKKHHKLWYAAMTPRAAIALQDREQPDNLIGSLNSYIENLMYYCGGLYEIGEASESQARDDSLYVDSFDLRNRHSQNWITIPKNQWESNWCTEFAVAGTIESYTNLYYNRHLDLDLSETYLAYKANLSFKTGSHNSTILYYAKRYGVIDEASYPFVNDSNQTWPISEPDCLERIKFGSYHSVNVNNSYDNLKYALINHGPCTVAYGAHVNDSTYKGHALGVIGYGKVTPNIMYFLLNSNGWTNMELDENDPRLGLDYWICKDNYYEHPDPYFRNMFKGHEGYVYIIVHESNKLKEIYYLDGSIQSLNYTDFDIACSDEDGDGYYYWGIGSKPSHCPAWAPDLSDGDDSDRSKGHMNEYGYCEELSLSRPMYLYIANDSTLTQPENRSNYLGILRGATVTLQAQQTFEDGTQLLLDNGATLIINGITINGSYIRPYPGSKVVLNNGAKISKPFEVPLGVELVINSGSIE